jgi:hypothetical protein
MLQEFTKTHHTDEDGNPAGGQALATGIKVRWQKGPLGRGKNRQAPNGAFVETVLAIALDRLEWYQTVGHEKFACPENAHAIAGVREALSVLAMRTRDREARQVEGTHQT